MKATDTLYVVKKKPVLAFLYCAEIPSTLMLYPMAQPIPRIDIDVSALVKKLGGRSRVHFALKRRGVKIPIRTIDSWVVKKNIPMDKYLMLFYIGIKTEVSLQLDRHLLFDGQPYVSKYIQKAQPEKDDYVNKILKERKKRKAELARERAEFLEGADI